MYENINRVDYAFYCSDAPASRRLCNDLDSKGLIGELASLLFRAQKARKQARNYSGVAPVSGRPYRDYSKDRMREMLDKAICLLQARATAFGIPWGWRRDDSSGKPPWVLQIDLPSGPVAYRLPYRHVGPDYGGCLEGDSLNDHRVAEFCAGVLDGNWKPPKRDEERTSVAGPQTTGPRNTVPQESAPTQDSDEDWP